MRFFYLLFSGGSRDVGFDKCLRLVLYVTAGAQGLYRGGHGSEYKRLLCKKLLQLP